MFNFCYNAAAKYFGMHLLFIFSPKIAWQLSGKSAIAALRICLLMWLFIFSRKLLRSIDDFKICGEYNGMPIVLYLRSLMDVGVLLEVFVDKEYSWCPVSNPQVIIDLGAHFGDTVLYYHALFPTAKIIAVEPSAENYERLVKHVGHIHNVTLVHAAIGQVDGEVVLHLMSNSLGHSTSNRAGSDSMITVPQLSLASLLQLNDIIKADLIKFDIEGAEFSLFNQSQPEIFANAYIGEVHNDLNDKKLPPVENWFTEFKLSSQPIKENRFLLKAFR